ncbi:MAG: (4Fe-4S)-binding protein [Flavobacteriales bacterium]|nr:(4Fe-4S)-binding protein [Flavobacteriales bacterium]MCB9190350.1 (4Fe-4S)-binding protein [Flavobacteriales bacterium]MCB9204590.1 (4Fe-4S)-binding protein [Flavobacteriales bacterium]
MKKEYTNGEITVVWQADKCIHCGNCAKGLPQVFKPREKPWIQMESASSEEIAAQVAECPSGALSLKD